MSHLQRITHDGELLAIIIPASHGQPGIDFVTEPTSSLQLATMLHKDGHRIRPHVHNPVERSFDYTQEVLVVRSGRMRVDLYTRDMQYLQSHVLAAGDIILLVAGGHGFEALGDLDMVEIKQGPFVGERDKTRFDGLASGHHILP